MQALKHAAASAYTQIGVETGITSADPHRLILMLYEGAISATSLAKAHMLNNEIAAKGEEISRAIAIIDEGLKVSLDVETGGEIAQNLKALYEYMCIRLLFAGLKNQTEPLDEVAHLLSELKGAWETICKRPSREKEATAQREAVSYCKA